MSFDLREENINIGHCAIKMKDDVYWYLLIPHKHSRFFLILTTMKRWKIIGQTLMEMIEIHESYMLISVSFIRESNRVCISFLKSILASQKYFDI